MKKVDGKQYTSNVSKLLHRVDKLKDLQQGKSSPIMIHIAPTANCNLKCTYCCYANRTKGESLSKEQVFNTLKQFSELGVKGVEWTGGGDPSMYPHLEDCITEADRLGYDQGLITNGLKFPFLKEGLSKMQWIRLSLHAINLGIDLEPAIKSIRAQAPNTKLSGVYIWTHNSGKRLDEVARITTKYEIPTRITPDLTLGNENIKTMMPYVKEKVKAFGGRFTFISDFNVKTNRAHYRCYIQHVKPFIFHDGNVYVCPSAALSPDNHLSVNDKFKVCGIEDILQTYKGFKKGELARFHDCSFCKYSQANELIDDVLKDVEHPNFA